MKNTIKSIFTGFLLMVFTSAQAQEGYYAFNYSVAIPMSDFSDYISKMSWTGASFEYRRQIAPQIAVGGDIGFNYFFEELPFDTYTEGTASISGFQNRYTSMVPIMAAGDYFFEVNEKLKPFAGLGVGTIYAERETDLGLFTSNTDTWFFAIRPELGFIYLINSRSGVKFTAKYYMPFDTKDLDAQAFLSLDLGWVVLF